MREVAAPDAAAAARTKIVVAGTNGKGSTCAMLESILLAAGYRVGCYTSPHLVRFNERARLDGVPASDEALIEQLDAVEAARGDVALTWFEYTTLAILKLFERAAPDALVLEIGLGGRLDAVNLVDADCAIVCCIDIDHAEFLGDTRERSAGRRPTSTAPDGPRSAPTRCRRRRWSTTRPRSARTSGASGATSTTRAIASSGATADAPSAATASPIRRLRGANQLLNASGALAALESLRDRLPVTAGAVRQGFATVELPGRFQVLAGRPSVVLDVAHNPHAGRAPRREPRRHGLLPVHLRGVRHARRQDVAGAVAHLRERVDHWLCVDLPGPRGTKAADLARILRETVGIVPGQGRDAERTIECHGSPAEALAAAKGRADENDRIVVFGSFLTVADVLASRERPAS